MTVLLFGPATASAQTSSANNQNLSDENLLVALPDGYKIDSQQRAGNMLISEMVPVAQTVADWTGMVTVQVFHDLKAAPEQFKARIDKEGSAACSGIEPHPVAYGDENGYAYLVLAAELPTQQGHRQAGDHLVQGHCGNDSFYVVQLAFKAWPSKEQITSWMHYLGRVRVCDTRLPQRACPNHSSSPAATDAAARQAKVSVPLTAAAAAVSAAAAAARK